MPGAWRRRPPRRRPALAANPDGVSSMVPSGVSSSAMMAQSTSPAWISLMLPSSAVRAISFLKPEKPSFFSSKVG